MLSQTACMEAVAEKIRQYRPQNIVAAPVMYAQNGSLLMDREAVVSLEM